VLINIKKPTDIKDKIKWILFTRRWPMDIPALSMAMSQNRVLNDFGIAMLSKNLDTMEENGAAMIATMDSMAELSVNPNVGSNIDIRV
jgi:hypothetical protein